MKKSTKLAWEFMALALDRGQTNLEDRAANMWRLAHEAADAVEAEEHEKAASGWSSEPPAKEGHYWCRDDGADGLVLCLYVFEIDGREGLYFVDYDGDVCPAQREDGVEWYSDRIKPPK